LYQRYILARKVNLDSGEWVADDVQTQGCKKLAPEHDPAKIHQRCTIADVYLVKDKSNKIQQIILPVFGEGAKSMMYAFLALDPDGRTVKNLYYYQQRETPFWEPEWKMKVGASNGRVKSG
jgi:Na+-transporting NADH:ubiquinone oxidoreductase subunit C